MTLSAAAKSIRAGGIVIYPTDTAYAIGCDYRCQPAMAKIMRLKQRRDKKFTLIAASRQQVERYFKLNQCQRTLAKQYWPGSLSIVVSARFAIRVPRLALARHLAHAVGAPLLATSVNVSGSTPAYSLNSIADVFRTVSVLNGGRLPYRKPSTIVECRGNRLIIHRQGGVHLTPEPLSYTRPQRLSKLSLAMAGAVGEGSKGRGVK